MVNFFALRDQGGVVHLLLCHDAVCHAGLGKKNLVCAPEIWTSFSEGISSSANPHKTTQAVSFTHSGCRGMGDVDKGQRD